MSDKNGLNGLFPAFLLPTGKGINMVHCVLKEECDINNFVVISCLCNIDGKPVEQYKMINSELWELGVQCYLDNDMNGMGWIPFIRSFYPKELKSFS